MLNWFRKSFGEVAIDQAFEPEPDPEPTSRQPTIGDTLARLGLKVAHFRPQDYGNPYSSARTTTVVYRPRSDRRHVIQVATAVCSEKDVFDRKKGVALALFRFVRGGRVALPPNKAPQSDYELLEGIFG